MTQYSHRMQFSGVCLSTSTGSVRPYERQVLVMAGTSWLPLPPVCAASAAVAMPPQKAETVLRLWLNCDQKQAEKAAPQTPGTALSLSRCRNVAAQAHGA